MYERDIIALPPLPWQAMGDSPPPLLRKGLPTSPSLACTVCADFHPLNLALIRLSACNTMISTFSKTYASVDAFKKEVKHPNLRASESVVDKNGVVYRGVFSIVDGKIGERVAYLRKGTDLKKPLEFSRRITVDTETQEIIEKKYFCGNVGASLPTLTEAENASALDL